MWKKCLLIMIVITFPFIVFAQQKGDVVISGVISWETTNNKSELNATSRTIKGNREFQFVPEVHYFFHDNFSMGLGIGYVFQKIANGTDADWNTQFDKLGMVALKSSMNYYLKLGDNFYYVPNFYARYRSGKYKYKKDFETRGDPDFQVKGVNVGVLLFNFEYKPSYRVGVIFNAGALEYSILSGKMNDEQDMINKSTSRNLSLGLNLEASIGFKFYL